MLRDISKKITSVLLAIGAAVLAMMMFLTALDVGLRYLFNRPLSGAFELVEYMMAIFIPFSIVYCAEQRGHVAVELIMGRFPKKVQTLFDTATTFLTLLFAVLIAWQNYVYICETYTTQVTSSVLLIPTYPFVAPLAIGISALAVTVLVHGLEFIRKMKEE